MKMTRRYPLLFLFAGLLVFLGLVFNQFVVAYLLIPVATVVWLLLRISVLSVDQQVLWTLLIVVIVFLGLFRFLKEPGTIEHEPLPDSNPALTRVSDWQSSILVNIKYTGENNTAKRNLIALLSSVKSSRQQGSSDFETEKALRTRQIDLPEPVYAFLFADEPAAPAPSFFQHPAAAVQQVLQHVRMAPGKWIRSLTGRDRTEYYQAIGQVLTLMETSLEIKYDDKPIDTRRL